MPLRPLRPCAHPGCHRLSHTGRCALHPRVDRRRWYHQRPEAHPQWLAISAQVLSEEPVCRICRKAPSTDVDHIVPKRRGGSDERSNLQGTCHRCHARKTASVDGGFGRLQVMR